MGAVRALETLSPRALGKVWGGTRLQELRGLPPPSPGLPVGETWEVSREAGAASRCPAGALDRLLPPGDLPYLVKHIDAGDALSVQVHPGGARGKTECWTVLEAREGAGVWLGLAPGADRAALERALGDGGRGVPGLLNFRPVRRGTFVFVPPGTVHAIGGGVLLTEVQHGPGPTYRIWDWGRPREGRPLHGKRALDALDFDPEANAPPRLAPVHGAFSGGWRTLAETGRFAVSALALKAGGRLAVPLPGRRFASVLLVGGEAVLTAGDASAELAYHQTVLVHKDVREVGFHCSRDSDFIVVS